jgi:hypothetical protein
MHWKILHSPLEDSSKSSSKAAAGLQLSQGEELGEDLPTAVATTVPRLEALAEPQALGRRLSNCRSISDRESRECRWRRCHRRRSGGCGRGE